MEDTDGNGGATTPDSTSLHPISRHAGIMKIDKMLSELFDLEKGGPQGCILSPILFNGEYIIRRTCERWEGGITVGGMRITNLRYSDDTTLLAAKRPKW